MDPYEAMNAALYAIPGPDGRRQLVIKFRRRGNHAASAAVEETTPPYVGILKRSLIATMFGGTVPVDGTGLGARWMPGFEGIGPLEKTGRR